MIMAVFFLHIFYLDDMLNSQIFNKCLQCSYFKNTIVFYSQFSQAFKIVKFVSKLSKWTNWLWPFYISGTVIDIGPKCCHKC